MYKPVFCTKTNGCLHLSDALGEEDMYVNTVGPPVKIRIHSSRVPPHSTPICLSNPLLLASAVDVVDGRSHCPFVIFLVGVCIRPLE